MSTTRSALVLAHTICETRLPSCATPRRPNSPVDPSPIGASLLIPIVVGDAHDRPSAPFRDLRPRCPHAAHGDGSVIAALDDPTIVECWSTPMVPLVRSSQGRAAPTRHSLIAGRRRTYHPFGCAHVRRRCTPVRPSCRPNCPDRRTLRRPVAPRRRGPVCNPQARHRVIRLNDMSPTGS